MRLLAIRWDAAARQWLIVDMDSRDVVERFDHLLDAGWFVQSEERAAS